MRRPGPRPSTSRQDTGPTPVEWLVLGLVFAVAAAGWFVLRAQSDFSPRPESEPARMGETSPDAPGTSPH